MIDSETLDKMVMWIEISNLNILFYKVDAIKEEEKNI